MSKQTFKKPQVVVEQEVIEEAVVPETTEVEFVYEPTVKEKILAGGKKHWKKIAGVVGAVAIGATVVLLKKDSDSDGIIEGHFEELTDTVSNTVQNIADTVVETVEEIGE